MTETFTCEMCGGNYEKGWSDEEAEAEAKALFGELALQDRVVVCEDCYKRVVLVVEA
jgi:hypothetical protein